jgi:hypothetical protein
LYFNTNQIGIIYLEPQSERLPFASTFVLSYPDRTIIDVFWHSDSYHLVLVSDKSIEALEAKPHSQSVLLVNLTKKDTYAYYDVHADALYFLDSQKAADGSLYDNLYKLELNTRTFLLQELRKLKTYE